MNININYTAQDIMVSLYGTRKYSSKTVKEVEQAVHESRHLLVPTIIYQWVDVISVKKDRLTLSRLEKEKTLTLHPGSHTYYLKNARICLIAVWTIGPDLDKKINDLNHYGKFFEAYLYDTIGLVALSKTCDAVKGMAECRANKSGWGVSPILSPGALPEWHLEEQKRLCSFLELEKAKIRINSHSVLIPFKSVSGLIGIGPGYNTQTVGSMCQLCAQNKTCLKKNMEG